MNSLFLAVALAAQPLRPLGIQFVDLARKITQHGEVIATAGFELRTVFNEQAKQGTAHRQFLSEITDGPEFVGDILVVREIWTHNETLVEQFSFHISRHGKLLESSHRKIRYFSGLADVEDIAMQSGQAYAILSEEYNFWTNKPRLDSMNGRWASTKR